MKNYLRTSRFGVAAMAPAILLSVGCAHVNEERLSTEMDRLRQEMQTADQAVENRLDERMLQLAEDVELRVTSLEAELGELRHEFGTTVDRLESAVRFNTPIHFAFDDATLEADDQELLDRFADVVTAYYDDALITVEGFTDAAGSEEYNRVLGTRRAEAVKQYLTTGGIPADRMRTVSYGEERVRQVASSANGPGAEGWQNRRVALVIDFRGVSEPLTALPN